MTVPSRPIALTAHRCPRPWATCRSTASWAMLVPRPPGRPSRPWRASSQMASRDAAVVVVTLSVEHRALGHRQRTRSRVGTSVRRREAGPGPGTTHCAFPGRTLLECLRPARAAHVAAARPGRGEVGERDRRGARARQGRVRAADPDAAPPAPGAGGHHDLPGRVRAPQPADPDGAAARAGRGAPRRDPAGGRDRRAGRQRAGHLPAVDARAVAGALARRDRPRGLLADLPRPAGARARQEPRPRPRHPQRAPDRDHPQHRPAVQLRGQPRPDRPG